MADYWLLLFLTVSIELIVALGFRKAYPHKLYGWCFLIIGLNLISHPVAWAGFVSLDGSNLAFWMIELIVAIFEATGLYAIAGINWKQAVPISVVINTISAAAGFLF